MAGVLLLLILKLKQMYKACGFEHVVHIRLQTMDEYFAVVDPALLGDVHQYSQTARRYVFELGAVNYYFLLKVVVQRPNFSFGGC